MFPKPFKLVVIAISCNNQLCKSLWKILICRLDQDGDIHYPITQLKALK